MFWRCLATFKSLKNLILAEGDVQFLIFAVFWYPGSTGLLKKQSACTSSMMLAASTTAPYSCHRLHSIHSLTRLPEDLLRPPPQTPQSLQACHLSGRESGWIGNIKNSTKSWSGLRGALMESGFSQNSQHSNVKGS